MSLLPQTTEYGLRIMVVVAQRDKSDPVRARDIAKQTHIPIHFLAKILRRLVTKGLLKARHGRGGGFTIGRPPAKIRLLDVLAAVNYRIETDHCVFGWGNHCGSSTPCPLHHRWSVVKKSLQRWAKETTLANLKDS